MKSFLKYILTFLFGFVLTGLSAQIKSGYVFGLNLSTVTLKTYGISSHPETPAGIHYGGFIEIPFDENLAFRPALLFSVKGSNYKIDSVEYSISPIYIEVPFNLVYSFGSEALRISMFGGPYIACGVGGYKLLPDGELKNINYGTGGNSDLKPVDLGINVGTRVSVREFIVSVQYGSGISGISPKTDVISEMKNKVLGISISSSFVSRK